MKVEYRRDLQNSYLVLIAENKKIEESYALRMITENQISGLLLCERKHLNNDILYYYDVTSKISLEESCKVKKIQGQNILIFMSQFLKVLLKLEEYLLNDKSICLLPQYIYMDEVGEKFYFCYVPSETWDLENQLRELMEYLLPYLEHEHQESMMIGYGIYHYVLREKFSVEGLYQQLEIYQRLGNESSLKESDDKSEKKELIMDTSDISSDELWSDIWKEPQNDKGNKEKEIHKPSNGFVTICAMIGFIWGLGAWFLWCNLKDYLLMWGIFGVVLGISFVSVKWYRGKLKKFKDNSEIDATVDNVEVYTEILRCNPYNNQKFVLINEEQTIMLSNKEIFIVGRDEKQADIVLNSNVVSRKHAQIRMGQETCYLTDLYSKNGTRVNGTLMEKGKEAELFGGEEVEFADLSYIFKKEN